VIKQADVVLAMFLLSDAFPVEATKRNFEFYAPLTTGDSSLSSCVEAIIAAQTGDEALLNSALLQLEEAELLFRTRAPPDVRYSFKHALVQDAAYESLLKSRRQVLHRRIADALRERFTTRRE
jgi:predicted ATPase